ncbi:hypothetical protein KSP39_PZI011973 [Platanthera zijinensis]|uniref:Protein FLX-like 4 n=1 Tax=Platanthera zijinensis TaxID=2320716 RepID=A0AAP0G4W6_9ASPA
MSSRGHLPSPLLRKPAQAPGMMRHGPFPGYPPSSHHPLEHVNPVEFLEKKIMLQEDEMDRLAVENRRLAATHTVLRQELVSAQHEIQRIHAHVGSIHKESEIKIRVLLDKIAKSEADIYASEEVRKELKKAHLEGQSLFTERQELTTKIQHMTEALKNAKADTKNLPEMHIELEGLKQEHKKLRSAFEYEKNLNKEQVEQMCGMEKNLLTMASEVEKLKAEIMKIEKAAQVPNQYEGNYGTAATGYPSTGQAFVRHLDQGYSQGVGGYAENANGINSSYPNSSYSHGGFAGYSQGYGMVPTQMTGGDSVHGGHAYSTAGVSAVYHNGFMMPPVAGGVQVGDGMSTPTMGATAGSYEGVNSGNPLLPAMPPPPPVSWR